MNNKEKYCGIVPPLMTTLANHDKLDAGSYEKMVDYVIKAGVHGIFPMASSGESVHNSYTVWKQANKLALDTAAGRVPVYCGAIAASTAQVIENMKYLESIGAESAVATAPFYTSNLLQSEVRRHYEAILDHTNINLCIYNMPGLIGGTDIAPETIAALAQHERVIMYKDSCPNLDHHLRTLKLLENEDISVLCGGEELCCTSILYGSQGNISGLAVSFPKLFLKAYEAAKSGNLKETVELQHKILELKNINHAGPSDFSMMKYALAAVGIGTEINCYHTEPLTEGQKREVHRIAEKFMEYH